MTTNITLELESDTLEYLEREASWRNTSLEEFLGQLLDVLARSEAGDLLEELGRTARLQRCLEADLPDSPRISALRGRLQEADLSESDYYDHLEEKHQ
jgi:hypothetical protein